MQGHSAKGGKKVGMLAMDGQVAVMEGFFECLGETVRSVVRSELEQALAPLLAPKQQTDAFATDPRRVKGNLVDKSESEKARSALGNPLLLGGTKEGQGMIDAKALSRFLDISTRNLYKLLAMDAVPKPVTLGGRSKRWHLEEIMAWVFHGCAPGEKWRTIRAKAMREYRSVIIERTSS